MSKTNKQIVQEVATQLLKSNNTVTTLEIKTQLRKTHGNQAWYQSLISSVMDELYYDGVFDYTDNGTFRVYSLPASVSKASASNSVAFVKVAKTAPKTKTTQKVSKTKALDLLQNTGGRYFGVTFTKKDGSVRNMKCKVLDNTNPDSLGYLTVFDATEKTNKKVNMQTLSEIRMNKTVYKIA